MTEVHIVGSIFVDGDIETTEFPTSPWPIAVWAGGLALRLTEKQAAALESQLTHVLAGIRTDALLGQS